MTNEKQSKETNSKFLYACVNNRRKRIRQEKHLKYNLAEGFKAYVAFVFALFS